MESLRLDCLPSADRVFGPVVESCARTFDFTLLFEESILSILPSSIFLIFAIIRIVVISHRQPKIKKSLLRTVKLLLVSVLSICSVILVALWSLGGSAASRTQASIPAAILSMVVCGVFIALSYLEHVKSVKPALLLDAYLVVSVLFDAVRVRTLWMKHVPISISILSTISLLIKLAMLVLEEYSKKQWIIRDRQNHSNEVTAGVISRTLFAWLDRLIWTGYSTALSVPKLPRIDEKLLSGSLWGQLSNQLDDPSKGLKYSLLKTVFWRLKWSLLAPVLPYLVIVASQLAQPYLITTVLTYVGSAYDGTEHQANVGYGLIAAYGLVYICIAIATAWGQHLSYRFVVMLRGVLVTAVYRKTLTLNLADAADASAVTLMSTDIERIALGMAKIHDAWSTMLQVGVAMYILYGQVGVIFVAPIVLSLVCTFGAIILSSFAGPFQIHWMGALEKRVAVTSSLLASIKGVKMLGWATKVSEMIQQLRLTEITAARKFRLMLVGVVIISFIPVTLAPVATFGIFTARPAESGDALSSNRIFTTLSLLALITQPLDLLFAYVPEILAAVACFSRIEKYLRQDSVYNTHRDATLAKDQSPRSSSGDEEKRNSHEEAVRLKQATFGWKPDSDPVLSSIDLTIPSNKLTMIIGPIASGKSTLLKGILGETPVRTGSVNVSSRSIAFCDQNPWMANETLQSNIIGSAHFDPKWYAEVIRACALEEDIARLPEGDQVIVGSNGLSLSGGQKQRVAIARAIYAKRGLSLFDDVFSGLDMGTQQHLMQEVFGAHGLLKARDATTIVVTHAAHLLSHADYIVALDAGGKVIEQGPRESIMSKEKSLPGIVEADAAGSSKNEEGGDKPPEPAYPNVPAAEKSVDEETQRLGDSAVYKYYFGTFGWPKTVLFFGLQVALVFCLKFPEIVLSWWGESNDREPNAHNGMYLGIFAALEATALISLGLICFLVLLGLAVTSGKKLHLSLLNTTFRAPLSFFSSTDVGSITNRFSQDISLIDAELPFSLINFVCNGLTCIAQALMIIPASAWLLIGYPILFGGLWVLQRFYLRTSRQLRFLDLEAKSPLYGQFLETLNGLATIRAFGWQEDLIRKADERLDFSQKPFYLLYSIQRWLNLVLDLVVACLAIVLIAIAVTLRNSTSVGFAGVALFNIMNLSAALKSAITSWTLLETSIGAVARVKRFEESTPDENKEQETQQPPSTWPNSGLVEFKDVTASYKDEDDQRPAISGMSFRVEHGEKVGICGRSGSGKSSTLLALSHLINFKGVISVDGTDIANVSRDTLRQRLTAVPQDPVFLTGNVRLNCDPHGSATDGQITDILRTLQLWSVIEPKGGLDAELSDDIFSKGQKQLFSLGRALLNHSNVVMMDETSSSLDAQSEELMMKLITEKFKDTTVISIAHRLDTIMDFDKVIVLENGSILEAGKPRQLLTQQSAFKALYESSMQENQRA